METLWGNSIFTNTALTSEGDVWWEGMSDTPAGAGDRLARQHLDPRSRYSSSTSERPIHRTCRAMPIDCARVARSGGRTNLGDPVRWAPTHHGPSGNASIRLGPRGVSRFDHGVGDHCGPTGRSGQSALRSDGDASVLRLQHGRLLCALAQDGPVVHARESSTDLLRQLVPSQRRLATSCGQAMARTVVC